MTLHREADPHIPRPRSPASWRAIDRSTPGHSSRKTTVATHPTLAIGVQTIDLPPRDRGEAVVNVLVPQLSALAIDCLDPLTLGRFWQQLIGGELLRDSYGDVELHGGALRLDFLRVPDHSRQGKNRLHLDLAVPPDVRREAITRAMALGASMADDIYDGGRWQVMRDPEGNEFCLVWGPPPPDGEQAAPRSAS